MSKPRNVMVLIAGWLCIFFAIIMMLMGALMYALEVPLGLCIGITSTSLFPIIIAVACLVPSKRTLALRVIGAVLCAGCTGGLIMSFVNPPPPEVARSPRRGTFVAIALAGAAMAVKGKWPGAETEEKAAT